MSGRSEVCHAALGDARALAAPDAFYDAAHLLGPLSHLPDRPDRLRALTEARRVVRPGGLVAAGGINRYASIFENAATANLHPEKGEASGAKILSSAVHDGQGRSTVAYFHRAEELAAELREVGLFDVAVFGIEGPVWSQLKAVEQHPGTSAPSEVLFQSALTAARLAEPYPELLAASSHLLAVGSTPN